MTDRAKKIAARTGGCLCGAVRFSAVPKSLNVGVCHCSMCRRWSGGVFMAIEVFPDWKEEGVIKSSTYISSDWAQRRFCNQCGSPIGWQMRDDSMLMLSASAFDDDDGFVFSLENSIDMKPDYYDFANNTHKMTEAEVLACFAEKGN